MTWVADEQGQVKEPPMKVYSKVVQALSVTNDERVSGTVFELLCRNELGAEAVIVLTRYQARGGHCRVLWADLSDAAVAAGGIQPLGEIDAGGTRLADLLADLSPCVIGLWRIAPGDPLASRLCDFRSLMSVPIYHNGLLDGVVVLFRTATDGFDSARVPEVMCLANLVSRTLRSTQRERDLHSSLLDANHQLHGLSQAQQQMLRCAWPAAGTRHVAVASQPAGSVNGDYYALCPLPGEQFGVFLADALGPGAAGAMAGAVLHVLTHVQSAPVDCPSALLDYVNHHLVEQGQRSLCTAGSYALYSPQDRMLRCASAGLPVPRLVSASGTVRALAAGSGPLLGVRLGEEYATVSQTLAPGDRVVFYTDGITETDAKGAGGVPMEVGGLDRLLSLHCSKTPAEIVEAVMEYLGPAAAGGTGDVDADDRTILVLGAE